MVNLGSLKDTLTIIVLLSLVTVAFHGANFVGAQERSRSNIIAGYDWSDPVKVTLQNSAMVPGIGAADDGTAYITSGTSINQVRLAIVGNDEKVEVIDKDLIPNSALPMQHNLNNEYTQYMDLDTHWNIHIIAGSAGATTYYKFDKAGNKVIDSKPVASDPHASMGVQTGPDDRAYILHINTGHNLVFGKIDPNGNIEASNIVVGSTVGYIKARFAVDKDSNLHVVAFNWNNQKFYYMKVDKTGSLITTTEVLSTPGNWDAPEPDIVRSPDGFIHLGYTTSSNNGEVNYLRLKPDGSIDAGPLLLSAGSTCVGFPKIAADQIGNAYVIWSDGGTANEKIVMSIIPKGAQQAPSQRYPLTDGDTRALTPDVEIDGNGDIHIAYIVNTAGTWNGFYFKGGSRRAVDAYFTLEEAAKGAQLFPGDEVRYNLTVKNNGTAKDTYQLKLFADLPPGWTANIGNTTLTLDGNATGTVNVSVAAPDNAKELDKGRVTVEAVSENFSKVAKLSNEVVSVVRIDHALELIAPSVQLKAESGVPVLVNLTVRNKGHAKEYANLTASVAPNWTVDLGTGPAMGSKGLLLTLGVGEEILVPMTVVPWESAQSGTYKANLMLVPLSFSGGSIFDDVELRIPTKRGIGLTVNGLPAMAKPFGRTTLELALTNDNNAGEIYSIDMEATSEYSSSLLDVTFDPPTVSVLARGQEKVLMNVTPRFEGAVGELINMTVFATVESPEHMQDTQEISLVMGRSLLILQSPVPERPVGPGKTVRFDITVSNAGDFDEDVSFNVKGLPFGWEPTVVFEGKTINGTFGLGASGSVVGTLSVLVPNSASYVGNSYPFLLDAVYGGKNVSVNLTVKVIDVMGKNNAPAFVTIPVVKAVANSGYIYKARAEDKDGDPLTFSIGSGPKNMSIEPVSGEVSWTPTEDQIGGNDVVIKVTDGKVNVTQSFRVDVLSSKYGQGIACYIISPTNGATIKGNARVSGSAKFSDLGGYVEVRVDDGKWVKAQGAELWYIDFESSDIKKGDHDIFARAVQSNGTSQQASIHVTVKGASAPPSEGMADMLLPILVIIIMIVVGIILLARRRLFGAKAGTLGAKARPGHASPARTRPPSRTDIGDDEYITDIAAMEAEERQRTRGRSPARQPQRRDRMAAGDVVKGDTQEVVIESPARAPTKRPAPPADDVPTFEMEEPPKAPAAPRPKMADATPSTRPQRTAAPPPKDQKMEGDIGELEKQFEDEEMAKSKKDAEAIKEPAKDDDEDLDDILAKLSSFEEPKKGGGAK